MYLKDFRVTAKSVYKGHHKTTYRGVETIKCPFDYVIYQMLIFDLKPDLVIEIGSNKGGGALYIADLLNIIGTGEIHTIDIDDYFDNLVKIHPRIKTFSKGYEEYNIKLTENYKKVIVIEDASHTFQDSLNCLKKFSEVVTVGSYYIVEDGIINKLGMKKKYYGGPLKAIKVFLTDNKRFIIDKSLCNMFGKNATFNINGYLKRIS